jgi:ferritin-like metal-binding protein YciE
MNMNALQEVYVEQLKDVYSAEKQLVEALPKMAAAASTPRLKEAFQEHLAQTRYHLKTVQSILNELDENPGNKVCKGMEGLVEEGNEAAKLKGDAWAKDAAIILAAQKVEHYEIATYGGLRAYAQQLGYQEAAETLREILDQEYQADQTLTDIALGNLMKSGVNEKATA